MSIAKRVLALAAASATALVLGGVIATTHQATHVDAAGPSAGAIGCANSNNPSDIAFATNAAGSGLAAGSVNGQQQLTTGLPGGAVAPGALNVLTPLGVVECGAIFQDTPNALFPGGGFLTAVDNDPNTVDGGTITYNLSNFNSVAQILESNAATSGINCGSSTPPTGTATAGGAAVIGVRQVQTIAITGANGGAFSLQFGGQNTTLIAFGSSANLVQQALNTLDSIQAAGGVTVTGTGTAADPYVVTFNQPGPRGNITIDVTGLTGAPAASIAAVRTVPGNGTTPSADQVTISNATGGTFTLSFVQGAFDGTTAPLAFNATAAQVQAALNTLAGVIVAGGVTVTGAGTAASPFVITFNNNGLRNPITASGAGLTPAAAGAPAGAIAITTAGVPAAAAGNVVFAITNPGGLESCQGGVANGTTSVSPSPGNIIHVAFRTGTTFGSIGTATPTLLLSATYRRFDALSNATFTNGNGVVGNTFIAVGPNTFTVGPASIGVVLPTYYLSLSASPSTIAATATGGSSGATVTATLYHLTTACVPVSVTNLVANSFTVCTQTAQNIIFGNGTALPAGALQAFTVGAEPGVVTFTTTSGFFGSTSSTVNPGFAQQVFSTHCGAIPNTAPVVLIPQAGLPFTTSFSFTSCQTATATLFGGNAVGTATVTANFVGDFTGATASNATTVAFSPNAATVPLTRGCNEVIVPGTLLAAGASSITGANIVAAVQPAGIVLSIWQFNNSLHAFQALYFSVSGAPTDIASVAPGSSVFICVSSSGTFPTGAF